MSAPSKPKLSRAARELLASGKHWEKLADEAERMAAWDRKMGFGPPEGVTAPKEHQAKTFRATAAAVRKQAETGVPHCSCHLVPSERCPARTLRLDNRRGI